jgi:hypothetical protein
MTSEWEFLLVIALLIGLFFVGYGVGNKDGVNSAQGAMCTITANVYSVTPQMMNGVCFFKLNDNSNYRFDDYLKQFTLSTPVPTELPKPIR